MRFSEEEVEAVRSHYGRHIDPELESSLRDDSPEDEKHIDVRRRYRCLLEIWAGRKAARGNVHTSHCCEKHGCKYGDDDCTVTTRAAPQEYLCEECEQDIWTQRGAMPEAEKYARSVVSMDLEAGNCLAVDGVKLRLAKPGPQDGLSEAVLIKAQFSDLVWAVQMAYLAGRLSPASLWCNLASRAGEEKHER